MTREISEEEHKYRCLVRWVIKYRMENRDAAHKWLRGGVDEKNIYRKGWMEVRPDSPLEKDVINQWKLGNRGEYGEWKI